MTHSYKQYSNHDFFDAKTSGPCFVCKEETKTVEINFETHMHRWCVSQAEFGYFRALGYKAKDEDAMHFQNSPNHAIMI